MTPDPYKDFAERYDWMGHENPARRGFFRTLFEKRGVKTVLDCACGTGEDLVCMHSLGVHVEGSDISEAMLQQASQRLASENLNIPLRNADFRELTGCYDAVLCMTTSLPHLLDEKEILEALCSMHRVLNPGGLLILSQGLTDKKFHDRPRFIPIINNPDASRIMVIDYFETEWEVHLLDLIHTHEKLDFKRASFRYKLLLQDDYERLLADAGFSRRTFYCDWDLEPYDKKTSRRLIVVAEK